MATTVEQLRGCLAGLCLADSIASGARGLPRSMAEEYAAWWAAQWPTAEAIPEDLYITDGAQLACEVLRSFSPEGLFEPEEFATRVQEAVSKGWITQRYWETHSAVKRLRQGAAWQDSGSDSPGSGSVHRAPAAGLACWDDPAEAARLGAQQSLVTHANPLCLAAAGTIAALVASVLSGEAGPGCPALPLRVPHVSPPFAAAMSRLQELLQLEPGDALQTLDDWTEPPAREVDAVLADDARAITLWSLYCTLRNQWNYRDTIREVLRGGGEMVAAAAISGALCGAAHGMQHLPPYLTQRLSDRGRPLMPELDQLALRFHTRPRSATILPRTLEI